MSDAIFLKILHETSPQLPAVEMLILLSKGVACPTSSLSSLTFLTQTLLISQINHSDSSPVVGTSVGFRFSVLLHRDLVRMKYMDRCKVLKAVSATWSSRD